MNDPIESRAREVGVIDKRNETHSSLETRGNGHSAQDVYLSLRQLERYSGFCVATLRRFIREAKLPAYRLGKKTVVLCSEFDAWMKTYRVKQPSADLRAELDAVKKRLT